MAQYIDKDALVAEIERRLCLLENGTGDSEVMKRVEGVIKGYKSILSFLDTLEVKEVDLEKEVEDWVKTGPHTSYPWCTIPDAIRITAKHFFELGLKAQKGE